MEKNFVVKHLNRFFFKLNSLQALKFVILFYGKNCRSGGMADATDSKSVVGNNVRVQVPPSAPAAKRAPARLVFFLPLKQAKTKATPKALLVCRTDSWEKK